MSKYDRLWAAIGSRSERELTLTFAELGALAGVPLDYAFLNCKKELEAYGWQVKKISMKRQTVQFEKLA